MTKDIGKSRIGFDEKAVLRTYDLLKSWGNPFEHSLTLTNIASGVVASPVVQEDLLHAHTMGTAALESFISNRLESNAVSFYDPIKRLNLKSFAEMKVKKLCKVKEKSVTITAERSMFAKLIVISEKRQSVSMKDVLRYSLGPIPWSLALPDGGLVKTVKSKLLNVVEVGVETVASAPMGSVVIYDGMVLLQQLDGIQLDTFGEMSQHVLERVLKNNAEVIYFVTDQYKVDSVKGLERAKRASSGTIHVNIGRPDQKRPQQFKKFLGNPRNKLELVQFLLNDWSHPTRYLEKLRNRQIFATLEERCFSIRIENGSIIMSEIEELKCSQEEADTKIFFCCQHASVLGFQKATIITVDSDVALYAIHFSITLDIQLFVQIGTKQKTRILDITAIKENLGEPVSRCLPALHCFTGCDYTSAFHGIGKAKAYKILQKNERFQEVFALLGDTYDFNEDLFQCLQEFVCIMYGIKKVKDLNEARYLKFCSKKGQIPEPQQLPPTSDELQIHCKRVSYSTAIVKRALESDPMLPLLMVMVGKFFQETTLKSIG